MKVQHPLDWKLPRKPVRKGCCTYGEKVYSHLSEEERQVIQILIGNGTGIRAIGAMIGRSPSTVSREDAKRARLLRRARFPVPKSLEGYDFANVKLPDGYTREELLSLDFVPKAQDLVFYGRTGRGKTHLATALGMKAIERDMSVRFLPTAELVLQLGKAKRDGSLDAMLRDIDKADLLILDEFGYVPFDVDGARLLYRIITNSYERRSIIFTTNIEFGKWGTIFADDKLAAAIIDRIVHHGRLIEFTGQSHRISQALMFGKPQNQ